MSRLSLHEWLWGGRVSDPPVKAGAERKKKTVGLFLERGNPGWAPSRRGGNPAAEQSRSKALKNTTRQSKKSTHRWSCKNEGPVTRESPALGSVWILRLVTALGLNASRKFQGVRLNQAFTGELVVGRLL